MAQRISILGSTGSIGTQALHVIDDIKGIEVIGLTTYQNIELLEAQTRKYRPKVVAVMDRNKAALLKQKLSDLRVKVLEGIDGLIEVATLSEIDTVLTAVIGTIGILPTVKAIEAKKNIALANKETLVSAGELVMQLAKEKGVHIYPVDSEHSAIFQCLQAGSTKEIDKIILTASGGPFLGKTFEELKEVQLEDALKHPNWNMGAKITVDSASLMNKGLEVIEAKWLFDVNLDKIQVVVHPQSIIHSMVEYIDGSIIAQMGIPDMKVPIQYALTYPKRMTNSFTKFDFMKYNTLTFQEPDYNTFKSLSLAMEALQLGGSTPAVLNAANEAAVNLFLNKKIRFIDIPEYIKLAMDKHAYIEHPTLEQIIKIDQWAKEFVYDIAKKGGGV